MKITDNIKEILQQWVFEWNRYFLPKIQLDRKDYIECNSILEVLWLKWHKWQKAHISNEVIEDLEETFNEILENWEVETLKEYKKRFQFFPTPRELAKRMVELAEIKESDIVCEPSAWDWAIADLIPNCLTLTLVELDTEKIKTLQKFNKFNNLILNIDFLQLWNENTFDKFVMNPPFNKRQDYKHIKKAIELLADWWRIVGLMSKGILYREDYKDLKEEIANHWYIVEIEDWVFKEAGTMIWTCLIVYNK